MSYILDALKKSEKERQKGTVPDMLTVQDIVAEKPAKRFIWVYLLVAALLLNAGIFVWWLGFSPAGKSAVVQKPMDVQPSPSGSPSPVSVHEQEIKGTDTAASSSVPVDTVIRESRKLAEAPAPLPEKKASLNSDAYATRLKGSGEIPDVRRKKMPAQAVSSGETENTGHVSRQEPVQHKGTGYIPSEPEVRNAETIDEKKIYSSIRQKLPSLSITADENKLYQLRELPPSIRQNLPQFSISALMYASNPASRMVRINDQMLREGQELSAGLTLQEITKDGVIFRHQKYKFFVGVK